MRILIILQLLLVFVVASGASPAAARPLEVRVGLYDNPPQVFLDETGEPQGLFPDLLRAVAEAENWSLIFVSGTFSEGLERLRQGEIDLMTAIAIRDDRLAYADFSRQSVLQLWSEVLSRTDADVHGLAELHKRRVAVSRGGNSYEEFAKLCQEFNLEPDFVVVEDFPAVLQTVADGQADAGVVSKLFAATRRKAFGLVSTGIIFNPFPVHFAAPKGLDNGLLEVIDRHLSAWQNKNNSVYYQSLNRWIDSDLKAHSSRLPTWLYPLVFGLIVSLVIGVVWVVTLRRKVRQATAAIAAREKLAHVRKDLLQQIIDNMPIGIWLSDAAGHLQLENPAVQHIWGRKGLGVAHYGELRGWWADSGQPLAKDDWGLVRALRDGQACLEERIEIEAVDGQRKIILASAVPLYDEQGRLTGGLEIEQDITEHRRAEQKIQDLARKWQETFDAVSDAIVILDRDFRVLQWNQAYEEHICKNAPVIAGRDGCQLFHEQDEPSPDCVLLRLQASGKSELMTLRQENRWWAVRADPLFDNAGNLSGAIQVFSDISQRKEFETLLYDERLALEMVATGAPLTAVLERIALNIEGQIAGALCSILLVDDERTHLRRGAAPSLAADYCRTVDGILIGPMAGSCGTAAYRRELVIVADIANDPLWANCRDLALSHGLQACWSVPVLDEIGEPVATVTTYFREPRAPSLENIELVQREVHLLQVVLERHKRELERQALLTLLEQRNVELEQFTYTVSHDLKTPLVTIGGFVGQLREDLKSGNEDCVAIDLDFIESAVKTMSNLLASLLNLARTGRAISEPQPIDMRQVIQLAVEFAKGDLDGILLQQDVPADLPLVQGDPERLREALQNLLENAAKFCRESRAPEIRVGCRVEGQQLVCWVSDNGIGIAKKYHTKIFNLFEKLDAKRAGTGIGLCVTQRIVEKHGGRIWVESEGPGQGSTFYLALPIVLN